MIGLRLFNTAGMFAGANRRTGCKYLSSFYGRVRTVVCIVSILTRRHLAVISKIICMFYVLKVLCLGPGKAFEKSLMFVDILSLSGDFLR